MTYEHRISLKDQESIEVKIEGLPGWLTIVAIDDQLKVIFQEPYEQGGTATSSKLFPMREYKWHTYWLNGTMRVLTGYTVEAAFMRAGYGREREKPPSCEFFYREDQDPGYVWDEDTHNWHRKTSNDQPDV